jgi:hypothetical protein
MIAAQARSSTCRQYGHEVSGSREIAARVVLRASAAGMCRGAPKRLVESRLLASSRRLFQILNSSQPA